MVAPAARRPAGFAIGLGTTFLLLFLVSKKAFCNYYFLVIALLMAGVAAGSVELAKALTLAEGRIDFGFGFRDSEDPEPRLSG